MGHKKNLQIKLEYQIASHQSIWRDSDRDVVVAVQIFSLHHEVSRLARVVELKGKISGKNKITFWLCITQTHIICSLGQFELHRFIYFRLVIR